MKSEDFLEGQLILIDKDLDWTSFDVVNKLRYAIRKRFDIKKIKVGHAGTLDPKATGLLLICTGKFTKKINTYMGLEKEYTGIIKLGATTPSYDSESEVDQSFPTAHIDAALIQNKMVKFVGEIMQRPPLFSAIKKNGERAYTLARRGDSVELPERAVFISHFEMTKFEGDNLHFLVRCSKGTYIRSLAHDLGKALNSGGYLTALRRTKIGSYEVNDALAISEFIKSLEVS